MSGLGGRISWGFLSGKHSPPVVKSPVKVLPPTTDLIVPTIFSNPSISGPNIPPQVGDLITAIHGTYIGTVTGYSGQWYSAGVPILGAVGLTYIAQMTDLGNSLIYRESALNDSLSSAVGVSNSLGLVVAAPTFYREYALFVRGF